MLAARRRIDQIELITFGGGNSLMMKLEQQDQERGIETENAGGYNFRKKWHIETKFDGERIQCHLMDNQVRFYTRTSKDYTYLYGPHFS